MKLAARILVTLVTVSLCILLLGFAFAKVTEAFYPRKYSEIVEKYSAEYSVEPELVFAVIKCESGFDPDAVSRADARGLMQMTEETFEWLQTKTGDTGLITDDLFDPEVSIRYGVKLLSLNLQEFGDEAAAVAAYHAGRTAVAGWLKNEEYSADGNTLDAIPYAETRAYVERVQKTRKIYETIYRKDAE